MAEVWKSFENAVAGALEVGNKPITIGVWNDSGVAGSGIKISAAQQFAAGFYGDDGGSALTAGWYSTVFGQMLVGTATAASVSAFGVCGELHLNATTTTGDNMAGVFAYAEVQAGKTLTRAGNLSFSGILAGVDVPSTAVIGADTIVSCIAVGGNFGGTHTGKLAAIHLTNPSAGAYDYLFQIGNYAGTDGTGLMTTITGSTTMTKAVKICIAGTAHYIPVMTGTT